MKPIDVTALGELLIDFTESGRSEQGNALLEANPGGAPANVLAMLAKLGRKTALIGKVGDDFFGRQLQETVAQLGIDTRNLLLDGGARTTLAFVHRTPDGDRDFSFYRDPGADMLLRAEEVQEELIAGSRVFHFGSLSMTHPGVREATRAALRMAEAHGCIRSFDPNLRPPLWRSEAEAREQIAWGLAHCDVLKIADDELRWFTGCGNYDDGAALLQANCRIPLILLTKGKEGSCAYQGSLRVDVPAFLLPGTVDSTGAGDTFCACALSFVLDRGFRDLPADALREMLTFANAAAALITTKKGALRAMPSREEVEALLAAQ